MDIKGGNTPKFEERIARICWAGHILSYLTQKRSHNALLQPETAEQDEEESSEVGGDLDAETERTIVLQDQMESIRSKFLDCVAQLLSPSKGWDSVTATALREQEDFVEIDVTRNDCFGAARESQAAQDAGDLWKAEADYCRKVEKYLSTADQQAAPSSEFELVAIAYTNKRVDYWVALLRTLLASSSRQDRNGQRTYENPPAVRLWTDFTELLYKENVEAITFREQIVQQAYECVASTETSGSVYMTFGANLGSRLWNALKFVARPITDCRMLWYIANRYPQFREVHIVQVPPRLKTKISPDFQIDISEAWAQLKSAEPTEFELGMMASFGERFRQDCATPYNLHAEMQLFMYYEDNSGLVPTLSYLGCSKKTCLMCEIFLESLPCPIATRGRHGICYPAWGVPPSRSVEAKIALEAMGDDLVSRIKRLLVVSNQERRASFTSPVPQSTFVTDFSSTTIQELSRKDKIVKSAREAEDMRREERLIIEGAAVSRQPKDSSRLLFEPEDSCVMCNKMPAKQCKQCRSIWYCSQQCQKSDWPSHKLLCKDFSTQASRPSPTHKRAIFFPVDREKPQMIWLPCESKVEHETRRPYQMINLHPYLGADEPAVGTMNIEHNPVRGRNLGSGMVYWAPYKEGYSVAVKFRDAFLKDGSAINKSILKSVGTSGIPPHRWCGPIIAVRARPYEFYNDITLADFRHIIDYLISYGTTETRESAGRPDDRPSTNIRGVKICCHGEKVFHGSESYVSVDVSRAHPTRLTHNEEIISPISKSLGMPLRLWRYLDIDVWVDPVGWDGNMTADSNPNAAFLMLETDPKKPEWGWVLPDWNADLGNVLAVRADDKDLSVDDMRMMCHFARRKLQPTFEDAIGCGYVQRTHQEVLDFITWENMMKCAGEMGEEDD